MVNTRMSWVWMILLFLGFTVHNFTVSLAKSTTRTRHHPTAVVVGSVLCDTCFHHQDLSKASHFISGATVAVECERSGFYKEVKTNKHGDFSVHLPFSVSKHVKKIKGCSVKLISSSEPYCAVASTATSSSLHLKYRKQGTHIFSAGFFTFKPLNQPELCNQKPSTSEAIADKPDFFNPIGGGLPLPPNPLLPPPSILPPNPLLPPPSIIPPIIPSPPPSLFPPLFPSPPPSIIPPIIPSPPRPPPSLFPPIPFIPGFNPSPPPPPPPIFPFLPLPPFPFQPTPGFPGVPPASTSSSSPVKNLSP